MKIEHWEEAELYASKILTQHKTRRRYIPVDIRLLMQWIIDNPMMVKQETLLAKKERGNNLDPVAHDIVMELIKARLLSQSAFTVAYRFTFEVLEVYRGRN